MSLTIFFLAKKKKMAGKKKDGEKDDSESNVDQGISNNKETADHGEGNDKTGFNVIKKVVNEEDSEKTGDQKKELRNSQKEPEKKAAKEGKFIGEEITSKISFGKKINQLEEALKKLREESPQ